MMKTIHYLLHQASNQLAGVLLSDHAEASIEANLLLQHLLKKNRAWLISHDRDVLTDDQQQDFYALLQRRLAGEPIAYILGSREFYGLPLKVTPATLLPADQTH